MTKSLIKKYTLIVFNFLHCSQCDIYLNISFYPTICSEFVFNNPKLRLKYEHKKLYLEHSHNMNWHSKMHSTLNSHLKLLSILYFFWETLGKSVIVYFKMIHVKWIRMRAYSLQFFLIQIIYLGMRVCELANTTWVE